MKILSETGYAFNINATGIDLNVAILPHCPLLVHVQQRQLVGLAPLRAPFAIHLPNPERVKANYAVLTGLSRGLSDGEILNVCVNATHAGSTDSDPARWLVTQAMLEREIQKVKKAKAEDWVSAELSGGGIAFADSGPDWGCQRREVG